jgi:cell division protein FtsB
MMRVFAVVMVLMLAILQYRLWVGDGSLAEVWALKGQVEAQGTQNAALTQRNRRLEADVIDLKQGNEVVEDRARRELGLIRHDETFFQIVDQ